MRGRKLVGSRRNVMLSCLRNVFMPLSSVCGAFAVQSMPGSPSYTITLSARYVAITKSCSTTNAVRCACITKRLITLAATMRCSLSRYADGSSIRYTCAGCPRHSVMAHRCASPPDRWRTSWSSRRSISSGFVTSVWNCGCEYASRILRANSCCTLPGNLGVIVCGLCDTRSSGTSIDSSSGFRLPASMRMNVVLPVPFWPSSTTICESLKSPASTVSLNVPSVFTIVGYLYQPTVLASPAPASRSSACSLTLNESDSSRKRRFSVGTKPARNTLMPSRTPNGAVTTPYTPGLPYSTQM
mmetsp:Transcript_55696/g.136714  ORF Transcript_55696/g.136714 Transcript_55696/m.136714 type:complete len:299 (-) Transcript_55696:954-1850(-)